MYSKLPKNLYNRDFTVDQLLKFVEEKRHCAVVGQYHIGKSVLVDQLLSKTPGLRIDCSKIGLSPENFAVRLIISAASYFLNKELNELSECRSVSDECSAIVGQVQNELEKIKPNRRLLFECSLQFLEAIGKRGEWVVCLDEFWKLLDMNNFPPIKDVVKLFSDTVSSFKHTAFILTGSAEHLMHELNKTLKLELVEVGRLRLKDVGDDDVYHYSAGVPMYAGAVKSRMKQHGCSARDAFVIEALLKTGVIYNSCQFRVNEALSRARGKALLVSILNILAASKDGMRLNEISRHVYRQAAVTKNLLSRLIEVDLVVKDGREFRIKDPVVQFWLKHTSRGIEFDGVPGGEDLKQIEVDL